MLLRKLFPLLLCLASLAAGAEIPRPSPDFTVFLNDGRQIHVTEYKGKVVVLGFILTTCPHCQFTSQILTKLQQEYGPRGLQVIASAIDEMSKLYVPDFITKFQPAYPVGYNQRETAEDYLQHPVMYRLLMPQVVVIDRKGTIRAQYAGDDKFFEKAEQEKNFRDLIEPLLKEGSTQTAARRKK
jgi:peroxiredoxin